MNQYKSYKINFACLTDKGISRERNEDSFIIGDIASRRFYLENHSANVISGSLGFIMAVADGVGGEKAGEEASSTAIEAVRNFLSKEDLVYPASDEVLGIYLNQMIFDAHLKIVELSLNNQKYENMQTTMSILWIFNDKIYISWSGDSRIYLLRPNSKIKMLSFDHSYVRELVTKGIITEEESEKHPYKNIITQSLGHVLYPPIPDFLVYNLESGDRLLACSDGLNTMLTNSEIESILYKVQRPYDAGMELINRANDKGGNDNITVLIADIFRDT